MLLFEGTRLGSLQLKNHIAMAPMTRSRAVGNQPNDLMVKYYEQRSSAGLIITEGTSPSPNGLGYARIPGLYDRTQMEGWKKVTQAVHAKGAKIFVQLMHTGRISHPLNMPAGAQVLAPSPIPAAGMMYTDQQGIQPQPTPKEMSLADIQATITEFAHSAALAIEAGFDGVELHSANGYLLEQFLNPKTNQRKDNYGGTPENRARFVVELAQAVCKQIGSSRVGIRLSPYGAFNDVQPEFSGIDEFFGALATDFTKLGLAYVHVLDHSAMGGPQVPTRVKELIRKNFTGKLIAAGGYDLVRAEADLKLGVADLIAFGRPFISNPDLPRLLAEGVALKPADQSTFYTPGEAGYTNY